MCHEGSQEHLKPGQVVRMPCLVDTAGRPRLSRKRSEYALQIVAHVASRQTKCRWRLEVLLIRLEVCVPGSVNGVRVLLPLCVHVIYIISISTTHEIVARKRADRRHTGQEELRFDWRDACGLNCALGRSERFVQLQDVFTQEHYFLCVVR